MRSRAPWCSVLALALALACGGEGEGAASRGPVEGAEHEAAAAGAGDSPARAADEAPWSDAWLLAQGERYLEDRAFRRATLEASLTHHQNMYSQARLGAYGLERGGWDALPEWVPVARPVDDAAIEALRAGEPLPLDGAAPLWDGRRPTTMEAWIELGRRVFFDYPLRPEVFAEHALARPGLAHEVGLFAASDGTWPGLVAFRDLDRSARVGITCALCHVARVPASEGPAGLVPGRARRELDYGRMRLAYHRDTGAPLPEHLAARMAEWGPGRADITQDDDEDPVAIPDLWGMRALPYLTQAGTLRHEHPAALAIRQETQLLQANRERTRPPRELAWALALYVYSLEPPAREPVLADARTKAGARSFERHCASCHAHESGSGTPVPAERVGTDATLALGRARGTGKYRPSPLLRVADAAPYLHHGAVATLEDLLDPARLHEGYARGALHRGPVPGHDYGTELPVEERAALIAYLRTL